MATISCAIATPHYLATEAGRAAVASGGNAIDAAVAAATVLTVVYPHMCAVGGDLWAIVVDPDGQASVIDGSGASALGSSAEELQMEYGSMPVTGPMTITVPGAVGGWSALIDAGANLDREDLFAAAIHHACHGVPAAQSLTRAVRKELQVIESNEGLRSLLAPRGRPLDHQDQLVQPALARSIREIAVRGDAVFYGGELGATLANGLASLGSPITTEDFARHQGRVLQPLSGEVEGFEILTSPPPSQGFVLLETLFALTLLRKQGEVSPATLARLFQLGGIDRDRFLADPRFADVPVADLLSTEHISELAIAATSVRETAAAAEFPRAGGDTVAVTTSDSEGRSVSLIESVFHSFGSGVLEPETGVLFHNRGSAFSLDPKSPNCFAPGKRPMHTLMPVVARKDRMTAALGTMGGLGQPQILTQLLQALFAGHDAPAIVARPRFTVGGPDVGSLRNVILAEQSAAGDRPESLEASGIDVQMLDDLSESVGHSQVSIFKEGTGTAASDPRSDGSSVVATTESGNDGGLDV